MLESLQNWRLLGEDSAHLEPGLPSLAYGSVHLLRLFVKMPEVMAKMKLPPKTEKILIKYFENILDYLTACPDLYSYLYST